MREGVGVGLFYSSLEFALFKGHCFIFERGEVMLLKILYVFLKVVLLFVIFVLSGIVILFVPLIYLCLTLKVYSFILFSAVLIPACLFGVYQGFKEFRVLTLKSLHEQLPFFKL